MRGFSAIKQGLYVYILYLLIDQILEGLVKSQYFTSLDLASGFHKIMIEKEDHRPKLAFSMGFGQYQY